MTERFSTWIVDFNLPRFIPSFISSVHSTSTSSSSSSSSPRRSMSSYFKHSSSNMSPQDPYPSPPSSPPKIDPILRNALRYTISAKEYKTLHQYLISRTPPAVQKRAPQPPRYASIVQTNNDFNTAAIRASLRVFVASQAGLKIWDLLSTSILGRGRPAK